MATQRLPIVPTNPDTSGNVYWDDYGNIATNDIWRHGVWAFLAAGNTAIKVWGIFEVPQQFVATAGAVSIYPIWSSTSLAGITVWGFAYRVVQGNNSESLDNASVQELEIQQAYAPAAANNRMTTAIGVTASNFVAGATVLFYIYRDKGSPAENLNATTVLHDLYFQYPDA